MSDNAPRDLTVELRAKHNLGYVALSTLEDVVRDALNAGRRQEIHDAIIVIQAIALLNSMVASGESHSDQSRELVAKAIAILNARDNIK